MLKKEQILNCLRKYGFNSLNHAPYVYQEGEKTGVYFLLTDNRYGNLERVLYFDEEEKLDTSLFQYHWFITHKDQYSLSMELSDYEIVNPVYSYKYKNHILTSDMMKNFTQIETTLISEKEEVKKKQLLRTAMILIQILKEKFKYQNTIYFQVSELIEELKKLHHTLEQKQNEYNKNGIKKNEIPEVLIVNNDDSKNLVESLYNELKKQDSLEELRHFINILFSYLKEIEMSNSHLQNKYLLKQYSFEKEDVQKKIAVIEEALNAKKKLFVPKIDPEKQMEEIDRNSEKKKMLSLKIYMEKEKKQIASKYEKRENINENRLGDYLANFEKIKIPLPEMINAENTYEEIEKKDLLAILKEKFAQLNDNEKSALYVATSFLKDCISVLLEIETTEEWNTNELISQIILKNKLELFKENYKVVDHYINTSIRLNYFSILNTKTFETFLLSLIEAIRIIKKIDFRIDKAFHGFYKEKSEKMISFYLKNIFNQNTSYVTTFMPKTYFYYSPISITKPLGIIDNFELTKKEKEVFFFLTDKMLFKKNSQNIAVTKFEMKKKVEENNYCLVESIKEKNKCHYIEEVLYNKEEGGFYD